MSMPRFSIVIPTRDRADTLRHTLRTCLAQDFADFEIVVSDNDSSPAVREVVESFADPKVKYVRTPRLLAMSDSWEFAVERAAGEFVTLIGNDDGLLLHALSEIDRLVRMLDATILRWDSVCYNWPDLPEQEHASANALLVPLRQIDEYYPVRRRAAAPVMVDVVNGRASYSELPMIYCSAIHRSWIESLRARAGRVFQSECPDIFSAFAFASLAGAYHSVAAPIGISGLSGKSNGVAGIYLKEKSPVSHEFRGLNAKAGHRRHQHVPEAPVMSAAVADSFLHAKAAHFPDDAALRLDRKQLVVNCINESRPTGEEEWRQIRAALRQSLSDDVELCAWFDSEHGQRAWESLTPSPHRYKRYGGAYMNLDASEFGVTNIFEAAELCEKLLGGRRDGFNYHVVPERSEPRPSGNGSASRSLTVAAPKSSDSRMISYAQNGEDVLLERLFRNVPAGFYIDVGANDPVELSVTKHFYDRGWRGINIEPGTEAYQKIIAQRSRDRNLNLGLAEAPGERSFYELPSRAVLSTFSPEQAALYRAAGENVVERSLCVSTLAQVCTDHVDGPIHFLAVDVEGYERQVLEGADWKRWRPMVVLIESTQPNTTVPSHQEWEDLLLRADYLFAYFDGLNRFYVRAESRELLDGFRTPLNVTDRYVCHPYQRQIDELQTHLADAQQQLAAGQGAQQRLAALQRRLSAAQQQLSALQALGPTALGVARLVHKSAARFPRVTRAVKRLLRRSSRAQS
jgi:FkbM family methyltransferase